MKNLIFLLILVVVGCTKGETIAIPNIIGSWNVDSVITNNNTTYPNSIIAFDTNGFYSSDGYYFKFDLNSNTITINHAQEYNFSLVDNKLIIYGFILNSNNTTPAITYLSKISTH